MRIAHPSRPFLISVPGLRLPPTRLRPRLPLRRHQVVPAPAPYLRVRSMATAANLSPVVSAEDEAKFGFRRAEMYKSSLANTVDAYDRHVFLCYKGPEAWAPRVEDSGTDLLPKLLSSAVKARKNDITVKTKLTICGGCDGIECCDGDVLVFPDMIKYKSLTESNVDSFVDDVFVNGKPWASGVPELMTGSHIFVCAHGSRDKRCGVCGPALIEKLNEEIELRGLKDQIFVGPCSHIGGHKYAGNLIIYSPNQEGKITGHWYGYVTPEDVPEVLDQHILNGIVIERLWRGKMGSSDEEDKKAEKQTLPNGKDENKSEKHQESIVIQHTEETAFSCCQGATGVSCCQDGSLDQLSGKSEKESKETDGSKGLLKFPLWSGIWEQHEVLTAAALIGAIATVLVAYGIYRRSA